VREEKEATIILRERVVGAVPDLRERGLADAAARGCLLAVGRASICGPSSLSNPRTARYRLMYCTISPTAGPTGDGIFRGLPQAARRAKRTYRQGISETCAESILVSTEREQFCTRESAAAGQQLPGSVPEFDRNCADLNMTPAHARDCMRGATYQGSRISCGAIWPSVLESFDRSVMDIAWNWVLRAQRFHRASGNGPVHAPVNSVAACRVQLSQIGAGFSDNLLLLSPLWSRCLYSFA